MFGFLHLGYREQQSPPSIAPVNSTSLGEPSGLTAFLPPDVMFVTSQGLVNNAVGCGCCPDVRLNFLVFILVRKQF